MRVALSWQAELPERIAMVTRVAPERMAIVTHLAALTRAMGLVCSPLRDISRGFTRPKPSSRCWQSCAKLRARFLAACARASTIMLRTRAFSGGRKNVSAARRGGLFIR